MERVGRLMRRTMPSERFPAAPLLRQLYGAYPLAPQHQRIAQFLLQCPDAAAEGGLGDVALLRRM